VHPPWEISKITPEQTQALADFKAAVKDYLKGDEEDIALVRWLLARQWVVKNAAEMFIKAQKWRKENRLDNFLEWYPKEHAKWFEILQSYFPNTMAGDRGFSAKTFDGFPVVIECMCFLDGHILKYVPSEELNWFYVYILERLDGEVRKIMAEKKQFAGAVILQDTSTLTLSHLLGENLKWLLSVTEIEGNYYPELTRKIYLTNASAFFTLSWRIIKNFIDPAVALSLEILAPNEAGKILDVIPAESVPKELGGKSDYLISQVGGGDLSKYTSHLPKPFKVQISAWKDFTKEVEADKAGTNIGWEFSTESYDIGFEVTGPNGEVVVPYQRHNSNAKVVAGLYSVENPGKYLLRWDNSYSYTNSKILNYSIFVDGKVFESEEPQ